MPNKKNDIEEDKIDNLNEFIDKTQYLVNPARALTNSLIGFNILQKPIVPTYLEKPGYVFITRPMLNLTVSNLVRDRKMVNLISDFDNPSVASFVRGTLDPITLFKFHKKLTDNLLVDPQNAFIPVMSNFIKTLSGWEDLVNPTKTVGNGLKKEEYVYVDGVIDHYRKATLDLTFDNIKSGIILALIDTWTRYQSLKFEGVMKKHLPLIIQDRVSYHSRIYRFTLTHDERYVQSFGCNGYCFPVTNPVGKQLDYKENDSMYNDTNRDITIRFDSVGFYYNDPIVIRMFNMTVSQAHSGMELVNAGKSGHEMVKVPHELINRLSNISYPRINPLTYEFEWWTDKEKLEEIQKEK